MLRTHLRLWGVAATCLFVVAVAFAAPTCPGTITVDFDTFPGPDGEFGTKDDVAVKAGDEISDQFMSIGLIVESALSSTGEPGLFAMPTGPSGSETDDIFPTSGKFAASLVDQFVNGEPDLETSSTGAIFFRFFPPAASFCLDFLDVEGSGSQGTGNTYIDVTLANGTVVRVKVPGGSDGNQQKVGYTAPSNTSIVKMTVSLNDGVVAGESSAIDTLSWTPIAGCWLTSGGFLNAEIRLKKNTKHTFGGNVGPPPSGAWEHVDHATGLNFHSNDAHIVKCLHDGGDGPGNPKAASNTIFFEGTGRLNNVDGFAFSAKAVDRGEPGKKDEYYIKVWRVSDGTVFIDVGGTLAGGNIQIHGAK